jgi:MFS transporter, ACDE family, multidrug resistance protein
LPKAETLFSFAIGGDGGNRTVGTVGQARDSGELPQGAVLRATAILIALRVGYAYNWFDIGPGLPAIGAEFAVGPADWGLLIAAFLVGAGLLQVPAGFLSRRYGPRAVSIWGVGLLAVTGVASAVAPSFAVLLAARLFAGVGAALFFSPAIGLVASLYPPGHRGLPVGTFSSAFSAGAGLGIIGSSLLIPEIGWRGAMAVGGISLGTLVLLSLALIPRAAGAPPLPARPPSHGLPRALTYRGVWAIGLAFVGMEGATFATGQFIVPYGEAVEGWSIALAGVVGMMFVLPSLFGGPLGGPIAERHRNHRTQFALTTLAGAAVLALIPFAGLVGAVLIGIVFSLGYGFAYAVMYVIPHFWREVPPEEIPLAIGLFNSVQLSGGAVVSFLFGWVVSVRSYAFAWEVLAVVVVATLAAIVALPPTPAAPVGPRDGVGPSPS